MAPELTFPIKEGEGVGFHVKAPGLWAFYLYVQLEAIRLRSWKARSSRRFYHTFRDSPRTLARRWHLGQSLICLFSLMAPFCAIKSANALSESISTQDYPFLWPTCPVSGCAAHA